MDSADTRLVGFKRHLRAEMVPAEAVYLISERGVTALSGPGAERLAPLLDGTRSVARLAQEVSAELTAAEFHSLLRQLSEAGLLELSCPPISGTGGEDLGRDAAAAFWSQAGLDADAAARAISASSVEIIALDGEDTSTITAICAESGLAREHTGGGRADLSLVVCRDYLDPRLHAVNARHLSVGRPWLLAKPSGTEAWIGPLFRPGSGPCWACLANRLEGNRDEAHLLRRVLGARAFQAAPRSALPATRTAVLSLAVAEAVKWLVGIRADDQQAIYILDTLTLSGRHHPVRRRPQCTCCGDPGMVAAMAGRSPLPATRPEPAGPAGPADPGRVLAEYAHLIDPVTGIVAELRPDTRCPAFQHAFTSGRNRAIAASTVAGIKAGARYHSGGKGVTELDAKTGALCEAVERHCGTRHGDEATVRDSLRALGAQAVHPNACMLFDERQFAGRDRWNAACAPFHWVPERFDEAAVTDWTPVWSLLSDEQRLLPTAMLYYAPSTRAGLASVVADSNGNAAGAGLEDAVVRGFLELVERDAVALWWYNRTRQPAVSLEAFGDSWLTGLPAQYQRLGREVWALDVTSDTGIPVIAAVSRRTGHDSEDIVTGFGAHPDPRLALRHALTELGQVLPTADGAQAGREPHLAAWWDKETVASQPYLLPDPGQHELTAAGYGPPAPLDAEGVRAIARRCGFDILILDQSRPDIGMPVVKVLAPGLRHFWPRFAPGRLFDVPVSLGRLSRPTEYSALNPVPLYM